jgi:hypothetical protein
LSVVHQLIPDMSNVYPEYVRRFDPHTGGQQTVTVKLYARLLNSHQSSDCPKLLNTNGTFFVHAQSLFQSVKTYVRFCTEL